MKNCIALIIALFFFVACSPKTSTKISNKQPQWEAQTETKTPEIVDEALKEVVLPPVTPIKKGAFEKNTVPFTPTVVAGLKREACYGKCPAFELKLYSDGTVKYNGKANVQNLGCFIAYAGKQMVVEIQTRAEAIGYFNLNDQYPLAGKQQIYDVPKTTTFIKVDGREHRISNRHDSPPALFKFENYIESLIENLTWKPIRYEEF